MMGKRTLYTHETGPLIKWDGEFLLVEDLNPHVKTGWRMSRWEVFCMGLKSIRAALSTATGEAARD